MVTGALSDSVGQAGPSGRPGRTGSCCDRPISPPAGAIADRDFAGRSFQPAMVRAHARAWAMSMTAGNTQRGHMMTGIPARQVRPSSPGIRYNTAMASISGSVTLRAMLLAARGQLS